MEFLVTSVAVWKWGYDLVAGDYRRDEGRRSLWDNWADLIICREVCWSSCSSGAQVRNDR